MNQKVGRNDPCPCGSGKKYKNCCMGKEQAPKTYTPTGKRKFKATVLNTSSGGPGFFQGGSSEGGGSLQSLKSRFSSSDFRTKKAKEEPLPFEIPKDAPNPTIQHPETPPPLPDEEFKPASQDFRTKKEKEER